MKGKNISGKDAFDLGFGGLGNGFGGMMFESETENKDRKVLNTKVKNWCVDTCYTPDTGLFETGIESPNFNNGAWVIVDEYETKAEAIKRHKEWIKFMKTNPKKLTDIHSEKSYKF